MLEATFVVCPLYSVINCLAKGREENATLADLQHIPAWQSFPCRRLTMTVWLVAAMSLFEIQAFEDSDTDMKLKWQVIAAFSLLRATARGSQQLPASRLTFVVWSLYQSNMWLGHKGIGLAKVSPLWAEYESIWKAKCLNIIHYRSLPTNHTVLRTALDSLSVGENVCVNSVRLCCVSGCFEDVVICSVFKCSQADVAVCTLCHMVICLIKMLSVEAQCASGRIDACLLSPPWPQT